MIIFNVHKIIEYSLFVFFARTLLDCFLKYGTVRRNYRNRTKNAYHEQNRIMREGIIRFKVQRGEKLV